MPDVELEPPTDSDSTLTLAYNDDRLLLIRRYLPGNGSTLAWKTRPALNGDSVQHILYADMRDDTPGRENFPTSTKRDVNRLVTFDSENQDDRKESDDSSVVDVPHERTPLIILEILGGPSIANTAVYKCEGQDGSHLVLKLYAGQVEKQPDLTHVSTVEHFRNLMNSFQFCPPANSYFSAEAEAYKALESVQGDVVPYSYGFYEFNLPRTEYVCVGHVMEYIEGLSFADYLASIPEESPDVESNESAVEALYMSALIAIIKIHYLGISHTDISSSNMKILPPTPMSKERMISDAGMPLPVTVLVDFGDAASIQGLVDMGATNWRHNDLRKVLELFTRDAPYTNVSSLISLARKSPAQLQALGIRVLPDGSTNILSLLKDAVFLEALAKTQKVWR